MKVRRLVGSALVFGWDFVVGDDWTIALVIVSALIVTDALSRQRAHSWWPIVVAVPLALSVSLWRSIRASSVDDTKMNGGDPASM